MLILLFILVYINHQKNKIILAERERSHLVRAKKTLESEIEVKDAILLGKEIEMKELAVRIVDKNRRLTTLQEHVDQINTSLINQVNHDKIHDLLRANRDIEEIEEDRKKLLLSLEQTSIAMFERMERDFKGITERQKQLAALVKHGFSAKEISILFNISHKAVQTAKYRLKKQLELQAEDSLETFLKDY